MKKLTILVLGVLVGAGISTAADPQVRWSDFCGDTAQDVANAIVRGADGSTYTAGFLSFRVLPRDPRKYVYKFVVKARRADGSQWLYELPGAPTLASDRSPGATCITIGPDGNIYAAGTTFNITTWSDITVVKLDRSTGALMWAQPYVYASTYDDFAGALACAPNGDCYVAGEAGTSAHFTVIKLNNAGIFQWIENSDIGWAADVTVGPDGNIYATGYGPPATDFFVISLTPDGPPATWKKSWGGTGSDCGNSLVCDPTSQYVYVAGYLYNTSTDKNIEVKKLVATTGNEACPPYNLASGGVDTLCAIEYGQDGYVYVAGALTGPNTDFAVFKLSTDLQEQWRFRCDGGANGQDGAYDVACGADGYVYAAGCLTKPAPEGRDFAVVSLPQVRQSNDPPRWVYTYHGGVSTGWDEANALAYGLDGDIAACGYSTRITAPHPSGHKDFTVICLNPTAGLFAGSTEPSSGRHLVKDIGSPYLHMTYQNPGQKVMHCASSNGGTGWSTPSPVDLEPGQQRYPSIALMTIPIPEPSSPCVVYLYNTQDGEELRFSYYDMWTQTWQVSTLWPATGSVKCSGPPSLYSVGSQMHVVFPCQGPDGYYIRYVAFEYWNPPCGQYEDVCPLSVLPLRMPSIVCDGDWVPHVVFEEVTDAGMGVPVTGLHYAYKDPQTGLWDHSYPIHYPTGHVESYQPFIECYGIELYAPWSEHWDMSQTQSDIYYSLRNLPVPGTQWLPQPRPVTNTPSDPSESPTFSNEDAGDAFAFDENSTGGFDIWWARMSGASGCVQPTSYPSDWPHDVVEFSPMGSALCRVLWTEEDQLGEHEVWFKTINLPFFDGERKAYYAVECGQEQPSWLCLSRTGFKKVNEHMIDFGSDSVVYRLPLLDPRYDFTVKISLVHGHSTSISQTVVVDGLPVATVAIPPNTADSLIVKLPVALYEKDHRVTLCFKKATGPYAFCEDIRLYRYERPKKKGSGGGQSASTSRPINKSSFCLSPNPTCEKTKVTYSLPNPGRILLRVFDVSGRLTRVLSCGTQAAGSHSVIWDGKDDNGRRVAGGVYFIRLEAGNSTITRKVLLLD